MNIQPGDFCVVPSRPPVGPLISFASWLDNLGQKGDTFGLKFDHAEVWLGDGLTASAYPNRNGLRALTGKPGTQPGFLWSSGCVELTTAQREVIVEWCYQHGSVQYSALDYEYLVLHHFGVNAGWLKRKIESDHSYICSQYVDAAYQAAGVQLFSDGRWCGDVKPLDLALLLLARGARPVTAP